MNSLFVVHRQIQGVDVAQGHAADQGAIRNARRLPVERARASAGLLRILSNFLHASFQVAAEGVSIGQVDAAQMEGLWILQHVQVPAPLLQEIADAVDVVGFGGKRNNRDLRINNQSSKSNLAYQWVAHDLQVGKLARKLDNAAARADNLLRRLNVASLAEGHQRSPRAGDDLARTRAGHGRRGVDATRPVRLAEVLEAAQLLGAVHHDGGSLWGEAVLVGVARNRSHAIDAEIEDS